MDMTAKAIEEIVTLARQSAQTSLVVGGQEYRPVQMHRVGSPDPLPAPLTVRGLRPLVAYVARAAGRDGVTSTDLLAVHVESPTEVSVLGPLTGYHRQRPVYLKASAPSRREGTEFAFGRWLEVETMVIALQSLFVNSPGRADLLAILGNLRDETVGNTSDDGVSQTVSVKAGITLATTKPVPNPILLAPYRTFPEIEQPVSPFVVRLKRDVGGSKGVHAGLWEADGGAWQATAMASIEEYLRKSLPEGIEVLA